MSSSPNSDSTPSKLLSPVTKSFEKYGMTFVYHVMEVTIPEWEMQTKSVDGQTRPEWIATGKELTTPYVSAATYQDKELCTSPSAILLFSTADGPIMGIAHGDFGDVIKLLDPCAVLFDGKSRINLLPIFNVGRFLDLHKTAIRASQPPSEILLAAYPGFIIQNKMAKFQLKATTPFVTTPELTNDGV